MTQTPLVSSTPRCTSCAARRALRLSASCHVVAGDGHRHDLAAAAFEDRRASGSRNARCRTTSPPVEAQAAVRAKDALELLIGFGYAGRVPEKDRYWLTESGELALLTDC